MAEATDMAATGAPTPAIVPSNRRREVKLLVHPDVREPLLAWLCDLMPPDPLVASPYRVRSLYYDTDDMTVYRQKKDGIFRRFKLRLRTYPDAPDTDEAHLEIKWKVGDHTWKERLGGAPADLHALTRGSIVEDALPSLPLLRAGLQFHPKAIVEYERHAFVAEEPDRVRVTLDGPVRVRKGDGPEDLASKGAASATIARGFSVLELKFHDSLPFWQQAMTQRWQLPQVPFSKYVEAIHQLMVRTPYNLHFMPAKPLNDDILSGYQWA